MNTQQKNYALAKSAYQLAKDEVKAFEQGFIVQESIRNRDGSVPECLWALDIDNEDCFNELCAKLEADKAYMELCDAETNAFKELQSAEESLIDYGLSLPMPEGVRQTLSEHRKEWKVREKLIDLTFRLNTRTVKAGGQA